MGGRSWPSPSARPRSPAATSAARSTRSPRRASRRARTAARRSSRTAPARRARRTAGVRSGLCGRLLRRASALFMAIRVAVDALGGDHGPHEIVEGAVTAAADGIVPVLYGPPQGSERTGRPRRSRARAGRGRRSPHAERSGSRAEPVWPPRTSRPRGRAARARAAPGSPGAPHRAEVEASVPRRACSEGSVARAGDRAPMRVS